MRRALACLCFAILIAEFSHAAEDAAKPAKRQLPTGFKHVAMKIFGVVQGVGFRDFTRRTAEKLKIKGWVRNLPTCEVELEAEGPEAAIKEFEAAVAKGPEAAKVEKVTYLDSMSDLPLGNFEIRETPAAQN